MGSLNICPEAQSNVVVFTNAARMVAHELDGYEKVHKLLLWALAMLQDGDSLSLFGFLEPETIINQKLPSQMDTLSLGKSLREKCSNVETQCSKQKVQFRIMVMLGHLCVNKESIEELLLIDGTLIILDRTMMKHEQSLLTMVKQRGSTLHVMQRYSGQKWCDHATSSSFVVLQVAHLPATAVATLNQGVLQYISQQKGLLHLANAATEATYGPSAPATPSSSVSQNVWTEDYYINVSTDAIYGTSIPSTPARSSLSLDALDPKPVLEPCALLNDSAKTGGSLTPDKDKPNNILSCLGNSSYSSTMPRDTQTNDVSHLSCYTTPRPHANIILPKPRRLPDELKLHTFLENAAQNSTVNASNKSNSRELNKTNQTLDDATIFPTRSTQRLRSYDVSELEKATNGFSQETCLSGGSPINSFIGTLGNGQIVIVKEHQLANYWSDEIFLAKVNLLSTVNHPNIVHMIGFCNERRMLVYEHVNSYSLDWFLSSKNPDQLKWDTRQRIAIGIAEGLCYLHEGSGSRPIIHGEFISKNILVTDDYEPKIAETGLKWLPDEVGNKTCFIGATGYLAPEYINTGALSQKTDVYAYGVTLMELITGFKANLPPIQQASLAEWARPFLKANRLDMLVSERIRECVNKEQLYNMAHAAYLCINEDPEKRPGMAQVLRMLKSGARGRTREPAAGPALGEEGRRPQPAAAGSQLPTNDVLMPTRCYPFLGPTLAHPHPSTQHSGHRQQPRPYTRLRPLGPAHQVVKMANQQLRISSLGTGSKGAKG